MAGTAALDDLGKTITAYWDGRAQTYSNGVRGELSDKRRCAWQRVLARVANATIARAIGEGRTPRALDLGCGPGFFSILLADEGCAVSAVDMSAAMLERARANAAAAVPDADIDFIQCDASRLPFADATFDLAVSRNLTWLLRDPEGAYAEWLRVLRPGGKLVVFDANWYRYLVDDRVDAARRRDQRETVLEDYDANSMATDDQERRCERIAAELPLTSAHRPQWDVGVLVRLGAARVEVNEAVWQDLWTPSEQSFYASSPLFLIESYK
ncbi:MAG: class I SAM-dependent methyltransferase [Coriobacteriales bacterium]|nr:class I SAM-dependent methyltransferase [Coriobacteriales bacterium]